MTFTGLVTYTRPPLPVVLSWDGVDTKYTELVGIELGATYWSSRYSTMELPTDMVHRSSDWMVSCSSGPLLAEVVSDVIVSGASGSGSVTVTMKASAADSSPSGSVAVTVMVAMSPSLAVVGDHHHHHVAGPRSDIDNSGHAGVSWTSQ